MRIKATIWIAFFATILPLAIYAENQPTIEHITSNNGLSHNTIRYMLQDKTGFLWFGTLNGLDRYDGLKIKNFKLDPSNMTTLSSEKIKELHQDSYGHIWVRTYRDMMHCYDPTTESFVQIYEDKADFLVKHNLYYEDKQKNIWLGSVSTGCVKISFSGEKATAQTFKAGSGQNSISSNAVNDIFQDSHFNNWVLTSKGICLIKNNQVIKLRQDKNNNISYIKAYELNKKIYFVSINGDIMVYNLGTEKFERFVALKFSNKVVQTSTFQIATLGATKILVSIQRKGLYIYNTLTNQYSTSESILGEQIGSDVYLKSDKYGNVWAFNFTGNIWLLDKNNKKTVKLNLIPPSILHLIDEERFQLESDKHGNVWITTYGNGLFCYNLASGNLTHYSSSKDINGLASNFLLSIVLDKNENIWIGTENMGINKLSFANRNVQIRYPDPENNLRDGNVIRSFLEDKNQNIWVATKAGVLYQYDRTLNSKKTLFEKKFNVYSMFQDNSGSIWLGTKGNGIIELKNGNPASANYYYRTDNPTSLSNNTVFSLLKDKKGRLWVATFGGGVCVKTTAEGNEGFKTFFKQDEWVRFARYIFQDRGGDIWVATSNGVLRFNPDALLRNPKAYKYYTSNPQSKDGLSNPEVRYIFQDSKGNIWLATAGGGINKFIGESSTGNGIFKVYNKQHSMANDNIMAIQEDKTGCLWISTESGLHKLNPKNNLFQYYKFTNDFSSNIFSEAACLTLKSGTMLWGSLNGFYIFNPKDIQLNKNEKNTVILTGFTIFDEDAKINAKNAPLEKSISFSDKIELKASDKVFHIEFANLNFRDPNANQFMYILENYEKRWNLSGSINVATYRNVPPGKYQFMVKSVNSEGVWDKNVTTLEIEIQPPFWQSNFAIFLYLILLGAIGYFSYGLIMKFTRLNNAVKVERQLTDYKLRFFTNISHEFRTPLTLIKGSVDTLNEQKDKMNAPSQHLIEDLDKNTSHLMRLIDQLMEFRKLQNNKQKLNLQPTDAVVFLREIFNSFSNVASKTNIDYQFRPSPASIPIYLDKNKVDKIVFNMLSNAFKFTPRGGKISLIAEIDNNSQMLRIAVYDNGMGIPKEKQSLLFSRFMQINFSANGTGVGLSLVNEFTNLHKGKVEFKENEGGGSVFIVELPLNKDVYESDDFVNEQITVLKEEKKVLYNLSEFVEQNGNDVHLNLLPIAPLAGKKFKILVIDDNDDIRDFLFEKLSSHFEVITAENGSVGIKKGMEEDPDLIICDVMMPGMNGFDLTKKLKDDFATCHIPVILLTAYISDEHHTEGIQAGADAYISKPFSMTHLLLQINKLIEKREKLHRHYATNESFEELQQENENENESIIPERDHQFLKLVEDLLEQHLTNADFSVDDFAAMTNTGRTLFFKKIKYLTGYSPNEFIRVRRMKKAAELLKTYKYNVSEVSYMVGINDPFYFSKCFKAQFGCSPSHYINS